MNPYRSTESPLIQTYKAVYMLRPTDASPQVAGSTIAAASRVASARRPAKHQHKPLACNTCKKRKVRCITVNNTANNSSCTLCARLGTACIVPAVDERRLSNSRTLISQLYGRIAMLEAELEESRCPRGPDNEPHSEIVVGSSSPDMARSPGSASANSETSSHSNADSMISRLCGGQRQLNCDRAGRLRFFGPTSSLHLSENVTSSILTRESFSGRGKYQWQSILLPELQDQLFHLFWTYQHLVLPVIHKECESTRL
jgi:hypothetical protein